MTPRQVSAARLGERFMPRLWAFAYPVTGRRFRRARLAALKAWGFAFRIRVALSDV